MHRPTARICLAVLSVVLFGGADWLQFRGNHGNGVAVRDEGPLALNVKKNVAWKVALEGRGLSGPIVIGDRVVITSSSGFRQDKLHVLCFDVKTGDKLWERKFWATGRTMCHPKMCVATPTPASDGKRIFAFYSSNDLACLDLEGNLLWFRGLTHDFPNASNSLGMASSPVVAGDTLIVQVENDAESFATGIDTSNGLPRWHLKKTKRVNWTSPVVLKGKTRKDDLAILQAGDGVVAVRPKSGEIVWSYDEGASSTPSATVAGDTIYVPSKGLTALKPIDGKSTPEVLWQENRLGPSTPSPIVDGGRVYSVNRTGVMNCADVKNGELLWRLRLEGPFTSSPIGAAGYVYLFNESGLAQVVKTGDKQGEIVAKATLGETILCTPAIANGALYVRSDGHLWKIAD